MAKAACPDGPVSTEFREQMAKIRELRRVSLRQLSARMTDCGWPMPSGTLFKVEHGDRRITLDDAVAIAKALDMRMPAGLAEIFEPCGTCDGSPPAGFACKTCGTEA